MIGRDLTLRVISIGMAWLFAAPCPLASADTLHTADIFQVIPLVTDANAADLLLNSKSLSVVVAYSGQDNTPAQRSQLEMFARESHDWAGLVGFYALDVDKYPKTWAAMSKGKPWAKGPLYFMLNASVTPPEIATMTDTKDGVALPKTTLTRKELRDHINNFLKVAPLVWHIFEADQVFDTEVPCVLFVYRGTSPQTLMMPMQFQNFAYESQLYPNRVAFGLIDRDVYDPSADLGLDFPKQDNPYYVLYVPDKKNRKGIGLVINNPLLTDKDLEYDIYSYFGPNYGPIEVPSPASKERKPTEAAK